MSDTFDSRTLASTAQQDERPPLLYLTHRIPYPPNKGDKIRSYHLIKLLGAHYRVHLGTFIDDPKDQVYLSELSSLCESSCAIYISSTIHQIWKSLLALATGKSITESFYANRKLRDWVCDAVKEHGIRRIVVFSSGMSQFALPYAAEGGQRIVVDFVDVDSEKWRQYANNKPWPLSWLYRRESRLLAEYEERCATLANVSTFVSSAEAALFLRQTSLNKERIQSVTNGVDASYFDPSLDCASPVPNNVPLVVFTGAMDYWANEDAVAWFATKVMPELWSKVPAARFYVVGMRPTAAVMRLSNEKVVVTGAVEDVRPYLKHAHAVVAPMKIARGVQNKVLEAMAMARPVIATTAGLEGIEAAAGSDVIEANTVAEFVEACTAAINGEYQHLGRAARSVVMHKYDWQETLAPLIDRIEG